MMPFEYWTIAPGAGQADETAGFGTVHALVLPHQPSQRARGVLVFVELDLIPEVSVVSASV